MRHALGYAMTVVAALCWGASGVSADYLMEHHGIELSLISFFRMFTAGILTLGFALARARRVTPPAPRPRLLRAQLAHPRRLRVLRPRRLSN